MKKIKIIAEIAQAHDGSLGILHSYIDALAETGVDVIKFQTHIAEAESSEYEPFRVNFSYVDKTRYDYWKRMEFTLEQWKEIKTHCDEKNLEFMSSPFSNLAVDWLEDVGVKQYKIGSGEVSNLLLLERIAKTKKPVILSTGLSDWDELEKAVNFLKAKSIEVSVLQCTTAYPCPPDKWGLHLIQELKDKFNLTTGYSDHSGTPTACIAAASMGAEILEFHVVFDKRMFGPDASSSLSIDDVKYLVQAVRQVETAKNNPIQKEITTAHKELKVMFGKSLAVNKNLRMGDTLKVEDLEGKKPGDKGIPAKDFESIVGKKLKKDKNKWEFLNFDEIEE